MSSSHPSSHIASSLDERGRVPIDNLIQEEIERHLKKKSWNQLEICFKLQLVNAYLVKLGVLHKMSEDHRNALKTLIKSNGLTGIEYSNDQMKLLHIDMKSVPGQEYHQEHL
jgi:hypothetical protein